MILIKKLKGCHRMLLIKLVNSIKWKKWKIGKFENDES